MNHSQKYLELNILSDTGIVLLEHKKETQVVVVFESVNIKYETYTDLAMCSTISINININ